MAVGLSLTRIGATICLLAVLGACGLPRSGPSYSEIDPDGAPADYGFEVLPLTPAITRATAINEKSGFDVTFLKTKAEPYYLIERGDVLAITVWENADEGLLNATGVGATPLPHSKVDERGQIFVPYVGLLRASGRSLTQLRREIMSRLSGKTVDPQVDVFPVEQTGRSISIQGVVNSPGVYPIDRLTTHILPMLAKAGGVGIDPEVVRIKLRRGRLQGEIWLTDLYDNFENDVHLRAGDAIIAERDRRVFTALGAVNGNQSVQFPTRELSLIRALGIAGGLRDNSADPTGVFIFREEPPAIAQKLFPERTITEPIRVAYIVDLTEPAGMFLARDFQMRDRDTIYVTTAPYIRWLKILQAISPIVNFGGAARSVGGF